MRKPRALFLDFDDSFSFNVVQELDRAGLSVTVLPWEAFTGTEAAELLVLGPGPGHPDDYELIYPRIRAWQLEKKKIFGVCLGHQILWRLRGAEVTRSRHPLHGQKIRLRLSEDWMAWLGRTDEVWVQRYNSLAVVAPKEHTGITNHLEHDEVVISRGEQFISYQFHPESVGTNCRDSFFTVISKHLL